MDNFNNNINNLGEDTTKTKDPIEDMGMQFAFEGLTEKDFIAANEGELARFRRGYQAGLAMQPEASFQTEESKSMGR